MALLPVLERRQVFTPEELDQLRDEHHTSVERMGFLLQFIDKKGQSGVDEFLQCLREETTHRGHQEILQVLERSAPDRPEMSPVLDILDDQAEAIERYVNLNSLTNSLVARDVIPVRNSLDITNPYRSSQDNISRLIRAVQNQGVNGMMQVLVTRNLHNFF